MGLSLTFSSHFFRFVATMTHQNAKSCSRFSGGIAGRVGAQENEYQHANFKCHGANPDA